MKKFFGLFSKENSIRGASLILIITLTLSNLLGLFRDRFLAKNIDTYYLDIYYASFRIPDLIFNFLILGAITSAFIPIFSDFITKREIARGYKLTNSLINLAVLGMTFFAILLFFLMPYLVPLVVPKFETDRLEQVIKISRLLMLTPIFFSMSYIIGGVLNSFNRFLAYSLSPIIYNLSIIFGAAFLAPKYGLISVVYCVVAGAFLHFLIQLPAAIKLGFKYNFRLDIYDPAIKKIVKLMVPRTVGMGVNQLMLVGFTAIASSLAAGSITAFELSNNIQTMPIVVFGSSFATAIFPTLTSRISRDDKEGFSFYLNKAMKSMAMLIIPSMIVFILLRAQIVRLILGSGKFGWEDTRMTALTLGFFATSLIAQALIPLLARAFYALKNTKTPMYIAICSAVVSIALAYPFSRLIGVAGLALAFSVGSYFNAITLFLFLRKFSPGILNRSIIYAYLKIILIAIVMGIFTWLTMHQVSSLVDMQRFTGVFIQTTVSLVVAGCVYLVLSIVIHPEELRWAFAFKKDVKKASESDS